jgi:hypothetical protein
VTDPALDPGPVAGSALAGFSAAGFVAAGDVELVAGEVGERFAGRGRLKAAVGDDLPRPDPSPVELGRGLRQQPVLGWISRSVGGREDEPAGARAGVLGHLADLSDVPELGRLAELALADRPRIRIGDRHQPVGDL